MCIFIGLLISARMFYDYAGRLPEHHMEGDYQRIWILPTTMSKKLPKVEVQFILFECTSGIRQASLWVAPFSEPQLTELEMSLSVLLNNTSKCFFPSVEHSLSQPLMSPRHLFNTTIKELPAEHLMPV